MSTNIFDPHPVVTAVIPTRNRPELVQRAVRSALAQTFRNIEVLVVVDGPDPATLAALHCIGDQRLRVLALEESVGGAEARNVGARAAQGEWIALLDDDDEWLPQKLELQLQAALASWNDRAIVVSKYICRSASADRIRPRRLPRPEENICEYMFDVLCYFQTSTFFCSKALLLEVPFRKSMGGLQDIDWFLRVNSSPGVNLIALQEVLSIYYAPEERATITSKLGWQTRLSWGQANREFMTKRAYSRFIVGSCIGRAVEERAGWQALRVLLHEFLFVGRPSVSGFLLFCGMSVARPGLRRRVRNALFLASAKGSVHANSPDNLVVRT